MINGDVNFEKLRNLLSKNFEMVKYRRTLKSIPGKETNPYPYGQNYTPQYQRPVIGHIENSGLIFSCGRFTDDAAKVIALADLVAQGQVFLFQIYAFRGPLNGKQ